MLPEKLGVAVDPDTKVTDTLFQSLADKTKAVIVVGLIHVSPPIKYNQARLYAPGVPVVRYRQAPHASALRVEVDSRWTLHASIRAFRNVGGHHL